MALLEILALLPLALVFFFSRKKQKPQGWFTSVLFIYYGIMRFILDFFRATDIAGADARYFGLTPGQYSALVLIIVGVWIWKENKKV
jgi:phosphatidylglycerol:prolipoprotein diacylglycerol transferase